LRDALSQPEPGLVKVRLKYLGNPFDTLLLLLVLSHGDLLVAWV
jgi:hypothetical protein